MTSNKVGPLRRAQHLGEYALVRAVSALIGLMPERAAVFAGRALGWLYWAIGLRRRRIARENIEKAMPGELSRTEVRRLVRRSFIHLGLTAVEVVWMRTRVSRENILDRFAVEGVEGAKSFLTGDRGLLAFTPHLGNWELFGGCIAVMVGGLNALARPMNNPLVRRYTNRLREHFGIRVLSTRDGVRPMIKAIRGGEPVAILIDQHVNRAFVEVTFFGRPAATTAVVASLALRLNTPVFLAYSLREGYSFRHHGYVVGPLQLIRTGDTDADVKANTQMFNDRIEELVRRAPEQWLWTHRRWKLADRVGTDTREESTADVG